MGKLRNLGLCKNSETKAETPTILKLLYGKIAIETFFNNFSLSYFKLSIKKSISVNFPIHKGQNWDLNHPPLFNSIVILPSNAYKPKFFLKFNSLNQLDSLKDPLLYHQQNKKSQNNAHSALLNLE